MSLSWCAGCALPLPGFRAETSTFRIVDLSNAGGVRRYGETFDEAYYDVDGHGNVNIVLRGRGPGEPGATAGDLTQTIRMRSVWRPLPGRTVSRPTQINAVVGYFVTGGGIGDSLEGAGAVYFTENDKHQLTGSLDLAVLRPKRQLTAGKPLFTHAELSGEFRAVHDPRHVVQIINETERLFGPLPAPSARSSSAKALP